MIAFLMPIISLLPTFFLHAWQSYLQATTTIAVEGEKTRRQVLLETITGTVQVRLAQAAVIQAGMGHKAFWYPWLIAAIPATVWYAWGMINTTAPWIPLPHVATIPPQLKDYTDAIWQNLFLSGGIALGTTAIAGAIGKFATSKIP